MSEKQHEAPEEADLTSELKKPRIESSFRVLKVNAENPKKCLVKLQEVKGDRVITAQIRDVVRLLEDAVWTKRSVQLRIVGHKIVKASLTKRKK